ncbi:alpha/beta fold hydrolase [Actinocrispum sp. NPDC049592]|uniref:alpha/beta fold hydrolase n=1 Tax=Actinocrispum sp. NPDC049592 TaxID=3154835 RepID=UPI003437675D
MTISRFASEQARQRYEQVYDSLLDWPLPYEDLTVETSFGPTYVRRSGSGKPLVLLHGFAVTSLMWQRHVAELGRDHEVFAVDSIGEAGRTVQTAPIEDAQALADWLDQVLAGLGLDNAHLVGLSRGGWLALNQAIRMPWRLSRITALDPAGLAPARIRAALYIHVGLLVMLLPGFVRRRIKPGSTFGAIADPMVRRIVFAQLGFLTKAFMVGQISDEQLRSISVPTRIVLGGRSPIHNAVKVRERLRRLGLDAEIVDAAHDLGLIELGFPCPAGGT